ncbi:cell division regulator GpsB [Lentilactobacillus buchneri]|uniref:Cell cycle protein GpsB n=2 Tax=Lentilactobacillus buchneri TaxID=1581 RepID=J9W3J3_LENBU|nr:cell division regulator GpsB [Lentilactobacillus buchneri]MCC6100286.1 cell division regulator GpsB [Lactobacillus sp.]WCJ51759.1 cell division regulator GpsB [Lentilactobacillus sp. Egmn17]AFS00252.1 Cell division initiation protein [Lentilactobacillus buchneri subsp. silagei CD034]KRK69774.1 cell cycle protein gpsB [Lentilactobacillus buchneri DSM 20057]MCT2881816.1 cell division regulator GpsB [Lentilactobacillus buchneri]
MENINYTPKDILQKEFKQKMRGYDPNDVDGFLDDIIKDYETFNKELQSLSDENERLKVQVDELNKQIAVSGSQPMPSAGGTAPTRSVPSQPMSSATNMDILKRLSNLERRVFGSQLDNNTNDSHRL